MSGTEGLLVVICTEHGHTNCPKCGRVGEELGPRAPEVHLRVSRQYSVLYGAGLSVDRGTVYIDKDLPTYFIDSDGKKWFTDIYIITHECTETFFMDVLGFENERAHVRATETELGEARADGCPVDEYVGHFWEPLRACADLTPGKETPPDINLRPYRDAGEVGMIEFMRRSGHVQLTSIGEASK